MKARMIVFLFIILFSVKGYAQGTSRFEIWGLNKYTKAEFIELYKKATGKDLNYTYTCAADLEKMGFNDSDSRLWVDDIDKFLSGKINWDTTERLAIIRPIPANQYNVKTIDSLNQKALEPIITKLKGKDSIVIEKYLIENRGAITRLLISLNSRNRSFRTDCKKIILSVPNLSLEETPENINLLGNLLSVPDVDVCYISLNLIRNSGWSEGVNRELFGKGAVTLIDFLNSNLRTFRKDATSFLASRIEEDILVEKNYRYWISWIESLK